MSRWKRRREGQCHETGLWSLQRLPVQAATPDQLIGIGLIFLEPDKKLIAHLQSSVPLIGQFWSAFDGLGPDQGEIGHAAKVLCHGDAVVQVQNHMPPSTWNKDCLTWTLQYL